MISDLHQQRTSFPGGNGQSEDKPPGQRKVPPAQPHQHPAATGTQPPRAPRQLLRCQSLSLLTSPSPPATKLPPRSDSYRTSAGLAVGSPGWIIALPVLVALISGCKVTSITNRCSVGPFVPGASSHGLDSPWKVPSASVLSQTEISDSFAQQAAVACSMPPSGQPPAKVPPQQPWEKDPSPKDALSAAPGELRTC